MTETKTQPTQQIAAAQKLMGEARHTKAESGLVRIAMIRRGLTRHDLARSCGVSCETVSNWIGGGFPHDRSRWLVEAGFNYSEPVFSTMATLRIRQRCVAAFGFDPFLVSRPRLRDFAAQIGIGGTTRRSSLNEFRDAGLKHFAANPHLLKTKPTP